MASETLLVTTALLLALMVILMMVLVMQLIGMRREARETRALIAKMDWGAMLFNNVQQLKAAVEALEHIEKRLQKLEALEKVHLSNMSPRAGS
ncbi:MAG TPA: hypothetical protein VMN03_08520 [Burkholderiales bacterium]|nr:hypothetical protein [Burkholderiales bacterium]